MFAPLILLMLIVTEGQGQRDHCHYLPVPQNGRIHYSPVGAPVLLNTTASYSCDEGYVMSGGNERVCGLSGGWSGGEITCQLPKVYVSLGSTNYPVNNSHLLITALGENNDQALVCHVDNIRCCRGIDNGNPNDLIGSGEWLFPNGTAVRRSLDIMEPKSIFYRSRGLQLIRLHREESVVTPTGSYCCLIPLRSDSEVANVTFCVELVSSLVSSGGGINLDGVTMATLVGGVIGIVALLIICAFRRNRVTSTPNPEFSEGANGANEASIGSQLPNLTRNPAYRDSESHVYSNGGGYPH